MSESRDQLFVIVAMDFSERIQQYDFDFDGLAARIAAVSAERAAAEIPRALDSVAAGIELDLDDLVVLLSPAADSHLEAMARAAEHLTRKRFGRVIQMYAPMYLSNYCHSTCTYCGFSFGNKIKRLTLSVSDAVKEARLLHDAGIRHLLLLTGEDYKETPIDYLAEVCGILSGLDGAASGGDDRESESADARPFSFSSISLEVYPLKEDEYRLLRSRGMDGLAVYQETYDPRRYAEVHLGGMKKRMQYRLDCPDRAGRAGMRKIAVGALLGLSNPAADAAYTALHARHLMKQYWQSQVSLSLPRMRFAEGVNEIPNVTDREYVRYLFAMRLFLPDAGLNLSTRESPALRDRLATLCVTHMSAGSRTEPGGYSGADSTEQFSVEDHRSIAQVSAMLEANRIEPVFVDWSPVLK
ncbi:MAG: radical SAM protein [bacterium]|nr:radical SAM protein [bacterium]